MQKYHLIENVVENSIADEMGISAGDLLLKIDGVFPADVLDYRFMVVSEYIELLIKKADGEEWLLEIDKDENEDLGLEFADGLMDGYRACQNKCIFCFIDQMPPGLRETLYFKDDDARLSFLQGNYVTLTNLSDDDVKRIIRYHLSPVNISIHTTDPQLRCRMLNNRFAGEALKKIDRLFEAGISMNGQIVLCKGVNDGLLLERSIRDLAEYLPFMESVSVVPAGLTRYREGLYPLEKFDKEDAVQVLDIIHFFQDKIYKESGVHFIHASDEWYMLAGQGLPAAEQYDGYRQLENGVGMMRLLLDEFKEALTELLRRHRGYEASSPCIARGVKAKDRRGYRREISLATGLLSYDYINALVEELNIHFPDIKVNIYGIVNNFFGENITVSGLLTGGDIISQLRGKELGKCLLLPENILRHGEDVFLDGITLPEVEGALQVPVDIVKSSGRGFIEAILRYED